VSAACDKGTIDSAANQRPLRMDMYHSERQIGDDEDSLTEMNEAVQAESFSHDDVRFQRNVS
jgi:hypothetical protein